MRGRVVPPEVESRKSKVGSSNPKRAPGQLLILGPFSVAEPRRPGPGVSGEHWASLDKVFRSVDIQRLMSLQERGRCASCADRRAGRAAQGHRYELARWRRRMGKMGLSSNRRRQPSHME